MIRPFGDDFPEIRSPLPALRGYKTHHRYNRGPISSTWGVTESPWFSIKHVNLLPSPPRNSGNSAGFQSLGGVMPAKWYRKSGTLLEPCWNLVEHLAGTSGFLFTQFLGLLNVPGRDVGSLEFFWNLCEDNFWILLAFLQVLFSFFLFLNCRRQLKTMILC